MALIPNSRPSKIVKTEFCVSPSTESKRRRFDMVNLKLSLSSEKHRDHDNLRGLLQVAMTTQMRISYIRISPPIALLSVWHPRKMMMVMMLQQLLLLLLILLQLQRRQQQQRQVQSLVEGTRVLLDLQSDF
jgi:hypothetical protein